VTGLCLFVVAYGDALSQRPFTAGVPQGGPTTKDDRIATADEVNADLRYGEGNGTSILSYSLCVSL